MCPSTEGVLALLCCAFALLYAHTCAQELGRGPAYTNGSNDTSTAILFLNARKQAYSRHKLPIARPRLRTTTSEPSEIDLESETTPEPVQENTQVKRQAIFDTVLKQADIFELSSSDFSPAVAWPVPRRPASRRFRHNTLTVSSTARPLLKLMRPKPTRPPAYSLDGFVPKPSMIRVSSTEAPLHIRRAYAKTDAPTSSRNTLRKRGYRKNKTKPLSNDDDDDGNVFGKSSYKRKNPSSRMMMNRTPRKGLPGIDFPTFSRVPVTSFDCDEKPFPGMYADSDAGCQVWHMCTGVPNLGARHSFLCPNGTIFNERRGVCDWWYNVDCNDLEP
ncbi:uncharacterized protein LOC135387793 [Ornithodoros turicata]|uniref:uncharacterized protein LOC135387793 n=1 Tax=Ornithodoros turicata TaxID=34597 RepID=UPI0031394081